MVCCEPCFCHYFRNINILYNSAVYDAKSLSKLNKSVKCKYITELDTRQILWKNQMKCNLYYFIIKEIV